MEKAPAIDFSDALAWLQALLEQRVRALVNLHGSFSGCVLEGELERVETLPPDNRAVNLVIDARQGIVLDPEDVEVLLVGDPAYGRGVLEFHLASRVVVRLERV
jgi:hypothetical protein